MSNLLAQEKEFNGVILYAKKGKVKFYKAYGYRNYHTKQSLLSTDIFELASVSKQFTSMIIMMLQEEGKLQYDDPVSKYLDIPYKGITIRHLLTHTSGLPDYQAIMDKYWDKTKVAANQDILDYINKYAPPKEFEPGVKYEYSNTGYVLLASIAEKPPDQILSPCAAQGFFCLWACSQPTSGNWKIKPSRKILPLVISM